MRLPQSTLLPLLGLSLSETARAMGQSVPTVSRLRRDSTVLQGGGPLPRNKWGGLHHAYWSPEEEEGFLKPFLEEAERGGILVAPPLHQSLEAKLGRKVAPDKRHIKGDPEMGSVSPSGPGSRSRCPAVFVRACSPVPA